MKPLLRDTTLSNTILDVVKLVLPFTASGTTMPASDAQDVVIKLSAALKLATLIEQELSIHRFNEPGLSYRTAALVEETVTATVIEVDFGGGGQK
ncbi:hypothetical protein [Shinella sp. M31]|uniref:hypothetical protein n=1 Tax=Shinella sp. M31 TaxID=3368615 RepID=UPI003BA0AC10